MVADELKEKGHSPPRFYDSVTVLFSDFADFTGIAAQLGSKKVVEEIDFCFKEMDKIFAQHGIEKIKTIGDAFLCVGGLPIPAKDHAVKVVSAACEMIDFVQKKKKESKQGLLRDGGDKNSFIDLFSFVQ